jgi:hypothetical protein
VVLERLQSVANKARSPLTPPRTSAIVHQVFQVPEHGTAAMTRPLDVFLLLTMRLLERRGDPLTVRAVAAACQLPLAEVHRGRKRAEAAGLWRPEHGVATSRLLEFCIHGVPYAYPAALGAPTRGLATAAAAFADVFGQAQTTLVWPDEGADAMGTSLQPLHPRVVVAARADAEIYRALAALDCIRTGRARERGFGAEELRGLLGAGS